MQCMIWGFPTHQPIDLGGLDLICAPYSLYGVKYVDLVSLLPFSRLTDLSIWAEGVQGEFQIEAKLIGASYV